MDRIIARPACALFVAIVVWVACLAVYGVAHPDMLGTTAGGAAYAALLAVAS